MTKLILASASPRRKELLELIEAEFTTDPADVDESRLPRENPEDYALRIAVDKARTAAARYSEGIVIGADTIVVLDDMIMGKPASRQGAEEMLRHLSSRTHRVLTAVALADAATGTESSFIETTYVRFRRLTADEITDYVATGEPMDKAGAYGIQGRASVFVEGIDGCFFNVVGLPLSRLDKALKEFIV